MNTYKQKSRGHTRDKLNLYQNLVLSLTVSLCSILITPLHFNALSDLHSKYISGTFKPLQTF